jgi:hypothetical protein
VFLMSEVPLHRPPAPPRDGFISPEAGPSVPRRDHPMSPPPQVTEAFKQALGYLAHQKPPPPLRASTGP